MENCKSSAHCIRCGRTLLSDLDGTALIECPKCKTKNIIGGMYNRGAYRYVVLEVGNWDDNHEMKQFVNDYIYGFACTK